MNIKRLINRALTRVCAEMATNGSGLHGRGLSSEGYAGGYAQALREVQLVMNKVKPNTRSYWDDYSHLDTVPDKR